MPKVEGEPVSDAPDQADPERAGGKLEGDPGMEKATPWGGRGHYKATEHSVAVGEKPND